MYLTPFGTVGKSNELRTKETGFEWKDVSVSGVTAIVIRTSWLQEAVMKLLL